MHINVANKNGITLGDLRNVDQETEQLPDNLPIFKSIYKHGFHTSYKKVTEITANNTNINID